MSFIIQSTLLDTSTIYSLRLPLQALVFKGNMMVLNTLLQPSKSELSGILYCRLHKNSKNCVYSMLAGLHMFTNLIAEEFFSKFTRLQYRKGEIIIRADDPPAGALYLKSGLVRMSFAADTGDSTLEVTGGLTTDSQQIGLTFTKTGAEKNSQIWSTEIVLPDTVLYNYVFSVTATDSHGKTMVRVSPRS